MIDIDKITTIKETYTLPSKGMIYGNPFNPEITLRSMTNAEDMRLSGFSDNEYKKLCEVIEACIVGDKPPVHVYDMCIGDFEFLLHKLRIVTYGSKYPLTQQCPNCGEVVRYEISLDDLEVIEYNAESIGNREIILPMTNTKVKICFSTPRTKDLIKEKAREYKRRRKLLE